MIMHKKNIIFIFFLLIVILVGFLVAMDVNYQERVELKCSSYVKMDLSMYKSESIRIDTVFNFQQHEKEATMLLRGTAKISGQEFILAREVNFSTIHVDSGHQYIYDVTGISKGPTDSTPDTVFNELLSEISGDNKHIYVEESSLYQNSVLFGSPYADLLVCVKY